MKKTFILFLSVFFLQTFSSFANDLPPEKNFQIEEKNEKPLFEEKFPPSKFQKTFIRMLISLALVIILVLLTFWAFRKMMRVKQMQANNHKAIKIIERRALSPKTMLYLLEVKNKKILLSESSLDVRSHKFLEIEKVNIQKDK